MRLIDCHDACQIRWRYWLQWDRVAPNSCPQRAQKTYLYVMTQNPKYCSQFGESTSTGIELWQMQWAMCSILTELPRLIRDRCIHTLVSFWPSSSCPIPQDSRPGPHIMWWHQQHNDTESTWEGLRSQKSRKLETGASKHVKQCIICNSALFEVHVGLHGIVSLLKASFLT